MSIPSRARLRLGEGSQVGSQGVAESQEQSPSSVFVTERWATVMASRSWITSSCGHLSILVGVPLILRQCSMYAGQDKEVYGLLYSCVRDTPVDRGRLWVLCLFKGKDSILNTFKAATKS